MQAWFFGLFSSMTRKVLFSLADWVKQKYLEAVEQLPLFFVVHEFEAAKHFAEKRKLLVSLGAGGQLHVVNVFFGS